MSRRSQKRLIAIADRIDQQAASLREFAADMGAEGPLSRVASDLANHALALRMLAGEISMQQMA